MNLKGFNLKILLFGLVSFFGSSHLLGQKLYQDSTITIEERTEDLLSRMTLEDKFWQLFMIPGDLSDGKEKYTNGIFGFQVATVGKSNNESEQLLDYSGGSNAFETAKLINEIQQFFKEETRLGIPIIPFDEGLHGLVRPGATAFPQSIGLAATWDTSIIHQVGRAIAMEMKTRGIRQILSPVINIARDVRWGRTEETYGEDPFLTTAMGVAFISAFEKNGVIATPKHFIANVGDGGRDSYPIHFSERLLEEIYFPAFKAAFQKAGARSVMTSYNSLDGRQCTANNWLLNEKLKQEWGFEGFVISDAGATGGANVLHFTAKDYTESTEQAIENGLDVIFQTSYNHFPLFFEAFEKGMITSSAIDDAVRRVLRVKFEMGLFENPYVDPQIAHSINNSEEHRQIAHDAALKSIVLLKNDGILPISNETKSIAIIGEDALETRLGGYSGPGNNPISILDGIKNKLSEDIKINYAPGSPRIINDYIPIDEKFLFHSESGILKPGLKAKYYNNIRMDGEPELERIDAQINFGWTLFSPEPEIINYDFFSARWEGILIPDLSGKYRIGIEGDDGYRFFINEELVIDNWKKQSYNSNLVEFSFEKGMEYRIKIEFYETVGNVRLKLVWDAGLLDEMEERINEALNAAMKSDLAIIVAGIEEGEFRDRASLALPGYQEKIIKEVKKTGKPVVVILVGGSAITMENWIDHASGILDVWYPGDQGGKAIADVLFGEYNPAGRLPITFPLDEAQLPLYYNHKPTGRGDDYLNLSGKPLFPFGYGLSYTKFEYRDLDFEKDTLQKNEATKVTCSITNTGDFDGEEVVQLYIKDLFASVARPIMELKGFKRIALKRGETKKVTFEITPEILEMLNEKMEKVVEPGDFRIMVGASSNDIRLRGNLHVQED